MSNVLMTPSSVVETIRLSFPQAQIASKVTGAGFALACTLVPHSQSFRVSRMLDANEFDLTLVCKPDFSRRTKNSNKLFLTSVCVCILFFFKN